MKPCDTHDWVYMPSYCFGSFSIHSRWCKMCGALQTVRRADGTGEQTVTDEKTPKLLTQES